MRLPENENVCPTLHHRSGIGLLALATLLASGTVLASPEIDYKIGANAYRAGNVVGAMAPLKRAADAGLAPAQALYGEILDKAELDEEARDYLRMAADQGSADGQYALAVMLLAGEGGPSDPGTAAQLMRRAADQGHVPAITALAQGYISGNQALGTALRTDPDAARMLRSAAEAGYLPAIAALARAYRDGDFGLAVDPVQAEHWARRHTEITSHAPGRKPK